MDDCFQIVREGPLFHSFLFWAGRVAIGRYKKLPFLRASSSSMKSRLFMGQLLRHWMVPVCEYHVPCLLENQMVHLATKRQTSFVSTYVVIHGKWPRDITEARMITWVFILPGLVMLWIDFRRSCCRISFVCRKHSQIQPEKKKHQPLLTQRFKTYHPDHTLNPIGHFFTKKIQGYKRGVIIFMNKPP